MATTPATPLVGWMHTNRFEYKYLIDGATARKVAGFACSFLSRDSHARADMGWAYPTHSVYLDGPGLPLHHASVDGHKNRFKLRARFYDAGRTRPIFIEIKRRVHDAIIKERALVHHERGLLILKGHPPHREDLVKPDDAEQWHSLRRFADMRDSIRAEPRALVTYDREAWVKPGNDHVRMTFDRNLRGATYRGKLEPASEIHCPPLSAGCEVILELKFTERFPTWFSDMAQSLNLERRSMAKYCQVIQLLQRQANR